MRISPIQLSNDLLWCHICCFAWAQSGWCVVIASASSLSVIANLRPRWGVIYQTLSLVRSVILSISDGVWRVPLLRVVRRSRTNVHTLRIWSILWRVQLSRATRHAQIHGRIVMPELMRIFLTSQHVNNFTEVNVIDTIVRETPYDKLCSRT
jgi:hypothetical protein